MNFVPLLGLLFFAIPWISLYNSGILPQLWKAAKERPSSGTEKLKQRGPSPPKIQGGSIRKIIVITDAGIDDADALILALSRDDVEILALVAGFGNVEQEQATANINRVLRLFPEKQGKIPIYAGSKDPFRKPPGFKHVWEPFHGSDGLGDKPKVFPESMASDKEAAVVGVEAADAIFEIVEQHPGCIILNLAPLTDLATAIEKHDELVTHQNLDHVYILGGNLPATEKTTTTGSFTFRQDPDAAAYVLTRMKRPLTLIIKESYGQLSTSTVFERWYMNTTTTDKGAFVKAIRPALLKELQDDTKLYDEYAMAIAIDPSIMSTQDPEYFVKVELLDEDKKGKLVFEKDSSKLKQKNIQFVTTIDWRRVEDMLLQSLL